MFEAARKGCFFLLVYQYNSCDSRSVYWMGVERRKLKRGYSYISLEFKNG